MCLGIGILIGLFIGYKEREIREKINSYIEKTSKPDVGVTPASYGRSVHRENQDGDVGLVTPKTAQQLEWQEQEELRQMQHKVKVNP